VFILSSPARAAERGRWASWDFALALLRGERKVAMLELTNKILSEIQVKDWFLLIAGMAVPLAIQMFFHVNSLYHSWANTSNLLGKWNCYNWSRQNGKTIWAHEIWNISRSVWSGLRIDVNVEDKEAVRYHGRVTFESGHILFTVDACRHQEHYQVRFADCVITQSTVLRGVFLAAD
jgi:hypothetical protein